MKKTILYLLVISIFITISTLSLSNFKKEPSPTKAEEKQIPIEHKIGQMLAIGYPETDTEKTKISKWVKENKISGIIFYEYNIKSPIQIKEEISYFKNIPTTYPLFLMVDQEGGLVSRFRKDNGFSYYASAEKISNHYTPQESYNVFLQTAETLSDVGMNFNIAPCVDIAISPKSLMKKQYRSYGNTANRVFDYSYEFIKAHKTKNILTCTKHFPGNGSTIFDPHHTLPDVSTLWKEEELIPFKKIIEKYPEEPIMIGHSLNKTLDNENISILSSKTIGLLKEMGHKGIVVSDAIAMNALNTYHINELIIKGINAGIDVFLFPNHYYTPENKHHYMPPDYFINVVKTAITNGQISEERINKAFNKIIKTKAQINTNQP